MAFRCSMTIKGMTPGTLARVWRMGRRTIPADIRHVFVCVADHFEPEWQTDSESRKRDRVNRWRDGYADSVAGIVDSSGRPPQHTFFYPMECYNFELVEGLAEVARDGYGDVEVHLHHDNDSGENLREFLLSTKECLHREHGLLSRDAMGVIRYGFIHGNWALDNSHPDGRWCGVNDELTILRETGCYADFTMPAAPHAAQTLMVNAVYDAVDDPDRPKSHDWGVPVRANMAAPPESLLMIQGPLLLVQSRHWSKPKIENGNLSGSQPPSHDRVNEWLRAGVSVKGREDWVFIKLHTHGAQESNAKVLLGDSMRSMHEGLRRSSMKRGFKYHYVTAREMAELVQQARQGQEEPSLGFGGVITRQP